MFDDNDILHECWRDPGDDTERLGIYIGGVLSLLLSLSVNVLGLGLIVAPGFVLPRLEHSAPWLTRGWCIPLILLGGGVSAVIMLFFVHESRHWDLRKITADKVVAGSLLAGLVLFFVGLRVSMGRSVHVEDMRTQWLIGLAVTIIGAVLLLVSFVAGLCFAAAEALHMRPRKLEVLIDRRYGLDVNLVEHENEASAWERGLTPMIACRTKDGSKLVVSADPDAYDLADPGAIGMAELRGKTLISFHARNLK
jgi:hypothetical protein